MNTDHINQLPKGHIPQDHNESREGQKFYYFHRKQESEIVAEQILQQHIKYILLLHFSKYILHIGMRF